MRPSDVSKDVGIANVKVSADVCEVEFRGHITGRVVSGAVAQLKTVLAKEPAPFLVIDGTAIDGYTPDVRNSGVALLEAAKRSGVRAGVCIAPSAAVRMMGAAVAFVSSLPFDFVENRADADRIVERKRAQSDPRR